MMTTYLLINFLIIIIPLLFSFEGRIRFYRNFPSVLLSVFFVGLSYLIWDVLAIQRGDWHFHPHHVSSVRIMNLPIEEILFFIVVPYSCLFVYEAIGYFQKDVDVPISKYFIVAASMALIAGAFVFRDQAYTQTVLLICALFLILAVTIMPKIFCSRQYWLYLAISFVGFIVFNSILTAWPIVIYNEGSIWGVRLGTIPLEDFFYNYSMLSFYLMVYLGAKETICRRGPKIT